jgi:2,3-bisphosphoglycerate-independent phosphoglycerate mutase
MPENVNKPVVLIVLDGFGIASPSEGNAVSQANKPFIDNLVKSYPNTLLQASGEEVGLPKFEVGNSEVGHMNIGSGRVMYQNLPKIDKSIQDGSFFTKKPFIGAFNHVKENKSTLHIMGLLSPGGVHSHMRHAHTLLEMAAKEKVKKVFIHIFCDGRDAPKSSSYDFIKELQEKMKELKCGVISTISGRYWALDRDNNWDRIEKVYNAMVLGEGNKNEYPLDVVTLSYREGIYDEKIEPTVIDGPEGLIKDNDAVIFYNYRSDRAKEITHALVDPEFDGFQRELLKNLYFVSMTEYDRGLPVKIVFPTEKINNTLGEIISNAGLKQLRIAETEKYAHVTVFFNCGRIDPYPGEERMLVPSPQVESYDMKPEMSIHEVTDKLLPQISSNKYDFILLNYANPDMVGHTGNVEAAAKAVEAVDECLKKVIEEVLKVNGVVIITSDHGNCDVMKNLLTGDMDKEHSINPVPFMVISNDIKNGHVDENFDISLLSPVGVLSDVSTTVLNLLGLEKPEQMTGMNLMDCI